MLEHGFYSCIRALLACLVGSLTSLQVQVWAGIMRQVLGLMVSVLGLENVFSFFSFWVRCGLRDG